MEDGAHLQVLWVQQGIHTYVGLAVRHEKTQDLAIQDHGKNIQIVEMYAVCVPAKVKF